MMSTYTLGLSSCPNDTFIFHALLEGLVPAPCSLQSHMADVEALNALVCQEKLSFSKISVGACAQFLDRYAIMASGGALGFGCGPLVVAKKELNAESLRTGTVAIPGELTTANLLLSLTEMFEGPRKVMLFSDIIPSVDRGEVDLGVIIHEGRFTYQNYGLRMILDLGAWWEKKYGLPLPLGAIVVHRDVPRNDALAMEAAITKSLSYAFDHPDASKAFVRHHAQELDERVIASHISTFVTKYSLHLGREGEEAISRLVTEAAKRAGKTLPKEGLFLR
ncbi:MAG: 1,4-dihydroxy-6-naphthoate synthase [Desulfovibrio sp.]|nr:1,4-dihydroxy-6-naphthoate synthase [Desulfovibrio sp.]